MKRYRHPDRVPDPSDPDFLDWLDSAIPLRHFDSLDLPPRPPGQPDWVFTRSGRVLPFRTFTRAHHKADPADVVTGTGWSAWYPPNESDLRFITSGKVLKKRTGKPRKRKVEPSREYMDNPELHHGKPETDP